METTLLHTTTDPPKYCWSRLARQRGVVLTSRRRCFLDGCGGWRIGIRWRNDEITWPCEKGLLLRHDQQYQIV